MRRFVSTLERESYVAVSPAQAYSVLRSVAAGKYRLKSEDDVTMSLIFKSGISAFTYGETMAAHVVPADGGSMIKLTISPKVPAQLAQAGKNQQIADDIFANVALILQATRHE